MLEHRTDVRAQVDAPARPARRERDADPAFDLAVLDGLGEALVAIDATWSITHWNAAAERITGRARTDMIGTDLRASELLASDPQLAALHAEVMRAGAARALRGWVGARRPGDGAVTCHDVRVSPLPNGGAVALFVDVGDRAARDREMAERMAENEALRR